MKNTLNTQSMVYDYISVPTTAKTTLLISDVYENLGWEKTSTGFNVINFKRDHRIKNKNELNKNYLEWKYVCLLYFTLYYSFYFH